MVLLSTINTYLLPPTTYFVVSYHTMNKSELSQRRHNHIVTLSPPKPSKPRRKKTFSGSYTNWLLQRSPWLLLLLALIAYLVVTLLEGKSLAASNQIIDNTGSRNGLTIHLRSKLEMPAIGYGTCCRKSAKGEEVYKSTKMYLKLGGRLIDTAMAYNNHVEIGRAMKDSGVKRSEVWITSKVAPGKVHTYSDCLIAIDVILQELDTTYLDMLLIHTPKLGKIPTIELWKCLVESKHRGKIKAIGVSNFNRGEIEDLVRETGEMPEANEIQMHPWSSPSWKDLAKWQKENGIATIAYTSLGGSRFDSTNSNSVWPHEVSILAKKYDVTKAQILLKWALQNNLAVIPGSGSKTHIKENLLMDADFDMTIDEIFSIENSKVPSGWWDPRRGHQKYTDKEAHLPWAKRQNG